MKKKIVDWVQQALNGLKNQSKKKIVSLGLIGIIFLSVVSFSLFDVMFGPQKVTPAELVDLVFEKYDLELDEKAYRYVCKPKPKSDLEQEFAMVGVVIDSDIMSALGVDAFAAHMTTNKKINNNRFSDKFYSLSLLAYHSKAKDNKITENDWKFLKNIRKGDKIKIKFTLRNIKEISPAGCIHIEDIFEIGARGRMAVEKY